MGQITFSGGGMFAGIAAMMTLVGHETTGEDIALGMEAPYLFTKTDVGYRAGVSLTQPQWMNRYLHSLGLHLSVTTVPQGEVAAFLRAHSPALLRIRIMPGITHPAVFCNYSDARYQFMNIKAKTDNEPEEFSVSASVLKRRLEEEVQIYTISPCTPEQADVIPGLFSSLRTLDLYKEELLPLLLTEVTRARYQELQTSIFRALMQDLQPMMALIGDDLLAEELRRLNHHYRHVFTQNSEETVFLSDRISKKLVLHCISWYRENIVDRLYELGVTDEHFSSWKENHP